MSKKYSIFISALFCGFLALFMVVGAISPDKTFSELENRNLQQLPKLEAEDFNLAWPIDQSGDFFTGEFMSRFETYLNDQFPLRDGWVGLKAATELMLGKKENNNVYFCDKGTLITRFDEPNAQRVTTNLTYLDKLVELTDVPVYLSLIPGSVSIWADRLPEGAPNADQKAVIDDIAGRTQANYYDSYQILWDHRDEDIYYRTDHHWTSLGAYYGYVAMMEALGMEPVPLDSLTKQTVSEEFYGTTFSSSGVRWVEPDCIDIYVPDPGVKVTSWFTGEPEEGRLYAWEKLEIKDKYTFFMGGNQSLAVIENPNVDGPKIAIVRDSYTDSLVPFLTQHFSEIHLIDLRYNRNSVAQYLADNDIDMCFVLYSVSNFVTDTNFFPLAR